MSIKAESTPRTTHRRMRLLGATFALAVGLVALTGCGDDDDVSPQDAYCESADALRSSVSSLASLDLIAGGTDGLESALGQVEEDVTALRDNAGEAVADEIDALETALDDLGSAVSDLGGSISSDNVSAVTSALGDVASAADAVYGTLSDC